MSSAVFRRGVVCFQRSTRHPHIHRQRPTIFRQALTVSAVRSHSNDHPPPSSYTSPILPDTPPIVIPTPTTTTGTPPPSLSPASSSPQTAAPPPPAPRTEKSRPRLRATKAAIAITPAAVQRLRSLLSGPTPQLIRIGVRSKGCAGLSYQLDYADRPGPFDEVVEQDGVQVLIDSKALFSIIGSEMDWKEDALSAKFAFKNPNVKDACGCGESFSVGS